MDEIHTKNNTEIDKYIDLTAYSSTMVSISRLTARGRACILHLFCRGSAIRADELGYGRWSVFRTLGGRGHREIGRGCRNRHHSEVVRSYEKRLLQISD